MAYYEEEKRVYNVITKLTTTFQMREKNSLY
jgi:hypothetical protein